MIEDIDQQPENNSLKGYKILIIILAVILVALSALYFNSVNKLRKENAAMEIEGDTLQSRLKDIMFDFDNLKTENDTINKSLSVERQRADSLMDRLKKERNWNYAKVKKYEKELGTLRTIMKGYVRQIDSLNQLNTKLSRENIAYRKELTTQKLRAETAEEQAQELSSKIRKGAIVKARDISLKALNSSDREVSRAKRATRLRVDFILSANELATPGERTVFVRIIGPDGYVLASSQRAMFDYEGEKLTFSASRDIDYQNQDLSVSVYYNGEGIVNGKYKVIIYMDGYLIGSTEVILR